MTKQQYLGVPGKVTDDSAPRSFKEELRCMMFDGRRRAQIRARLMRRLDEQLAALRHAADSDIERVERDARELIVFTDVLLAHPAALHSIRDPGQHYKVKKKLDDLKTELAACGQQTFSNSVPHAARKAGAMSASANDPAMPS